jgi:hypothetical protein
MREIKMHVGQLECLLKEANKRNMQQNVQGSIRAYPLVVQALDGKEDCDET